MESVWRNTIDLPHFPELTGDVKTDVLIIGGTSLVVYPAAGLIDYYQGNKLVLVNKTPTARDSVADLVVQGAIGEIFGSL